MNYKEAILKYEEAQKLKKEESYPKSQIKKAKELLGQDAKNKLIKHTKPNSIFFIKSLFSNTPIRLILYHTKRKVKPNYWISLKYYYSNPPPSASSK